MFGQVYYNLIGDRAPALRFQGGGAQIRTSDFLGGGSTPPSSNTDLLGGGSTPPSSNTDLLGGGSDPPSSNRDLLGGGSGTPPIEKHHTFTMNSSI